MKHHYPKSSPSAATPRGGFTLIELLTVIAIVGILAAILIPTVAKVRQSATRSTCASNLRQIALGSLAYANDHKGLLPLLHVQPFPHSIGAADWEALKPYLGDITKANLMYCPGPLRDWRSIDTPQYEDAPTGLYVTYSYFGNMDLGTGGTPAAFALGQTVLKNLNTVPASFTLWTCLTYGSGGSYHGHSDPSSSVMVQGQNAVRADGSVRWVTGAHLMTYFVGNSVTFYGPSPGY
ncbi:MAG: type II secretion system protein [Opitutaceae bacterium]|jgi:general secretion pathway protein G